MKVILDVTPQLMGKALNTVFRVQSQNPQQKTGTSNGVKAGEFIVIRNAGSYTIKEVK